MHGRQTTMPSNFQTTMPSLNKLHDVSELYDGGERVANFEDSLVSLDSCDRRKNLHTGKKPKPANILAAFLLTVLAFLCSTQVIDAFCLTSDLPKGVLIAHPCGHRARDICHARCIILDTVVWNKLVMCMPHGKWSPLPTCQTTHTLELIRCNRISDMSKENMAACVKIKITVPGTVATPKAICPEILRLFVEFGSCRKKPETDCVVTCRNEYFYLMCLVNNRLPGDCTSPTPSLCPELRFATLVNCSRIQGVTCKIRCSNGKIAYEETFCTPAYEWLPLPACDFRSQCKHEKLPEKLHFLSQACKNSKALYCRVGCKVRVFLPTSLRTTQKVVFVKDTHCLSTGEWRGLPNCERAEKIFWEDRIKKWQCAKPKLDKHSIIEGTCSYLEGSACRYKCEKGFHSKGNYIIRCTKKRWHGFHKCEPILCPKLPDIYELKNNCPKVAHSVCETACRVGDLIGKSRIVCHPSGHWSALPLCMPYRFCPRKISPQILFVTKCSFKVGEKCQVRCQGNLVLATSNFVICRQGKWRDIPDCVPESKTPYNPMKIKCHFPPQLNGNLKLIGSCRPVGGMSCDIACRDDSAFMSGPNATTCLPPGLWSFVKPCIGGKLYCSAPKFHHIQMMEYCSGKEVGSTCQVRCRHRPSMKFSIICTNEVTWSTPPNCTCAPPVLKEGVELKENCGFKQAGQKCNVGCKSGFAMIGAGIITCNALLQWSPLPLCKKIICPEPKLTNNLMFTEDCSAIQPGKSCNLECKEGGKILYNSKINCINGKHWTKLPSCACPPPALYEDLETRNRCNQKSPGQKCIVSCKGRLFLIGKNYIVCQNNTKWSTAPRCKKKLCHLPILTDTLIFDEDCSSKQPGERCRMACKNLGSLVGSTSILCSNATRWSPLPTCSCPPPTLPYFIKAKENCSRKLSGEPCVLSCTDRMKIVGNATIQCQNDGHWSPLPRCKENICTYKRLPQYLLHAIDCTALQPGEKCFLECKEGGEIEGNNFTTCIGESQWTALPRCRCPAPKLSYYLSTTGNCSRKSIGESCHLQCNERHQLAGENFITCQNDTIWSPLPKCIRNICQKQKLPSFLIYAEDCSEKIPRERCKLECVEGGAMIGRSYITCINGTKWSSLPRCTCPPPSLNERLTTAENCSKKLIGQKCVLKCIQRFSFSGKNFTKCLSNTRWSPLPTCTINFCTPPKLPVELAFAEDCTSKVPGGSCLLECKGQGKLVGSNKTTCINTTKWGPLPKCTCPSPDLSEEDLSTREDCRKKLIGEECRVHCKGSLELLGSDLITCQNNSRWSTLPRCKRLTCIKPKLNKILSFNEDCTSKSLNENCELECSERGQIIGSKFITCKKKGHELYWSAFPLCTCGDPFLTDELKLLEKCHGKKPGESCKVNCTDKLTIILGGSLIHCQNNTKWTHLPKCVLNICMKPKPPAILELQEDCSSKLVGENCQLKCRNGGMLLNTSQISCSMSRTWTPFPNCTCPPITLTDNVKLLENCSDKLPGDTCRAACISPLFKLSRQDPLTCKNDSKWNFQPRCTKLFCSQPILPEYILFKGRCSNTSIGSICSVKCAQNGRLTGDNFIKCMNGSLWSKFPDCTCSKPVLPKALRSKNNCDFIKREERCSLICEGGLKINGNDFILCQNNTMWSSLPKCVQTLCPAPIFKSDILKLKEDCSKKTVADRCEVVCKHGGNIIGNKYIECRNDFKWSTDLPDCTCKTPIISEGFQLGANCSFKKKDQRCDVTCKVGYKIVGTPYIICQKNMSWTSLPQCIIVQCPIPILINPALKFTVHCINKTYNSTCRLNCTQGGKLIGDTFIKCTRKGVWSSLPDCTCPLPRFANGLKAKKNCNYTKRGEKCYLECEIEFRLRGDDFILCKNDSTWSQKPLCIERSCPIPVISSAISFAKSDCSKTKVGGYCKVRCQFDGRLIGSDRINCLPNETWSSVPDCTCNPPTLTSDIEFKENCTLKKRNEKCAVACVAGSKNTVVQNITCEDYTKWSALPTCKKATCPLPVLSFIKTDEDCSQKTPGEICHISCKENGRFVGVNQYIICNEDLSWILANPFQDCLCAPPILPDDLDTKENCGFKKRGEFCSLYCKNGGIWKGSDVIECQNNLKWTELPECYESPEIVDSLSICDPPVFKGDMLLPTESCSNKKPGEKCQVYCKHGGMVLGHDHLECLPDKTWSSLPDCTCPTPTPKENVELKEDCNLKKRNEKCAVMCTEGSKTRLNTNYENLICLSNAEWSPQPVCKKILCKIPISPVIGFNRSCLAGVSVMYGTGSCNVFCKENGTMIGKKQVRCLENQTWSELPDCACPPPVIPKNMNTTYDCSFVKRGNLCHLWCTSEDLLYRKIHFIICQNNSKWSSLPKCKSYCRSPDLTNTNLQSVTSCDSLEVGGRCHLRCRNNGKILGSRDYITCISLNTWSDVPECTCYGLDKIINYGLHLKKSCLMKRVNQTCEVYCSPQDNRRHFLVCNKWTAWINFPDCYSSYCPNPNLDAKKIMIQEKNGDCSRKSIYSFCRLVCRNGAGFKEGYGIMCQENLQWTKPSECLCPLPILTDDITIVESCSSKDIGEFCALRCKNGLVISKSYIICKENGVWEQLPVCKKPYCEIPHLAESDKYLMQEDCSRKSVEETCQLSCKKGGRMKEIDTITCLSDLSWTTYPECLCPIPILTTSVILLEDCSLKSPHEYCLVGCEPGLTINRPYLFCKEEDSYWDALPLCLYHVCPLPAIPELVLDFNGDCSSKKAGDVCDLVCKGGGSADAKGIMCKIDLTWSPLPICSCPIPTLNEFLEIQEDCSNKKPNERCLITCNNGYDLPNKYIICQENTQWEPLPACVTRVCPLPVLPEGVLEFSEDCTVKTARDTCRLRCLRGGNILGSESITCTDYFIWSQLPSCSCPTPTLNEHLEVEEDCSNKRPNEHCFIRCNNGYNLPNNYITCQENTQWGPLPACVTRVCQSPVLPEVLQTAEDCTAKPVAATCQLRCAGGGNILGSGSIVCSENYVWSQLPSCTCPLPILNEYLEMQEDCNRKNPDEFCLLGCRNGFTISKHYITCQMNMQWEPLPSCVAAVCQSPVLPEILQTTEDCTAKPVAATCQLRCAGGGNILGSGSIVCSENYVWSQLPSCTCPLPILNEYLEMQEDCNRKNPGEFCSLGCKNGFTISKHYITCQVNMLWEPLPSCAAAVCQSPVLPEILQTTEDCTAKPVAATCQLRCAGGGNIWETGSIVCSENYVWSQLPSCTCPLPILNEYLEMQDDCNGKIPGEFCSLGCRNGFTISKHYITCQVNLQWEPLPSCVAAVCQSPVLPEILQTTEDCTAKPVAATCQLRCAGGGNILGIGSIVCSENFVWSQLPSCTCPLPILNEYLEMQEDCNRKNPGEFCLIRCRNGFTISKHYITCQVNMQWEPLPSCVAAVCQSPVLPEILQTTEDCTAKPVAATCQLRCAGGGNILGSGSIVCSENFVWSQLPSCFCPLPILNEYLEMQEDCNRKNPIESCSLGCKNGFTISKHYITCQGNLQWEPLPSCVAAVCQSPVLPEILQTTEDCTAKPVAATCQLRCAGGGNILGSGSIVCSENFVWSQLPSCTCPLPILNEYLEMQEDCNRKNPGEFCSLGCKNGFTISKHYITCQVNLQWEPLPSCVAAVCRSPVLPEIIQTTEDCTAKPVAATCQLRCAGGGNILGIGSIVCSENFVWSQLPSCTCPLPILNEYLEMQEDCNRKNPGEFCLIRCRNGFTISKHYITCQVNMQWEPLPSCAAAVCQSPVLPEILQTTEDCTAKPVAATCQLRCAGGGNILGSGSIVCSENFVWSQLPSCFCPLPILNEYLEMQEDCNRKNPIESCSLGCKNGFTISKHYITCQGNLQWEPLPTCQMPTTNCPPPSLPPGILGVEGDCNTKRVGEKCQLRCLQGGYILESNSIVCSPDLSWSSLPLCTCPEPVLPRFYRFEDDCSIQMPREVCRVKCGHTLKSIVCHENGQWSQFPECNLSVDDDVDTAHLYYG